MGLFKRRPKDQASADAGEKAEETPNAPVPPAPSATHLALIAERETTASAHRKAEKAESAYRVRKRATTARTEYAAAKAHIKASWKEGIAGTKSTCKCVWLSPAVLLEKMSKAEDKKEKKALERSKSKREKMGEKMKKMEEEEEKRKKEAAAAEEEAAPAAE